MPNQKQKRDRLKGNVMIHKLAIKLKLFFSPPQDGDVYYGDPFDFIVGSSIEQLMHKMRDKSGYSPLWHMVPSETAVRLTIESAAMPTYYRCTSEVLVTSASDSSKMTWLKRVQPRRISKQVFHDMIAEGRLKKS